MKQVFSALALLCLCNHAEAHWPQFRGPNSSGVAANEKPPVHFSPSSNLLWKSTLGPGLSSPCVWGDKVFITTFENGKVQTCCLNARNGKMLWQQSAPVEKYEETHPVSSPAVATPATDGKRVYVYFSTFGLVAYDVAGREQWRAPLPFTAVINGSGTSPILADGRLILNCDQEEGKSFIAALNTDTGKIIWQTPRPGFVSSYTTPIYWPRDSADIVVVGSMRVVGYNFKDGKERWTVRGTETVSVCSTPVIGDGQLYAMSRSVSGMKFPSFSQHVQEMDKNSDRKIESSEAKGMLSGAIFRSVDTDKDGFVVEQEWSDAVAFMLKGEPGLLAVRPPGEGDITDTHVAWKAKRGLPSVSSPLFYRGRIYLIQDGGRASCFDAKSGNTLFEQERIGADGEYYASPIAAGDTIYLTSNRGVVTCIRAVEKLDILARNDLAERITSTPAIADHTLFIRTEKHLSAFHNPK